MLTCWRVYQKRLSQVSQMVERRRSLSLTLGCQISALNVVNLAINTSSALALVSYGDLLIRRLEYAGMRPLQDVPRVVNLRVGEGPGAED